MILEGVERIVGCENDYFLKNQREEQYDFNYRAHCLVDQVHDLIVQKRASLPTKKSRINGSEWIKGESKTETAQSLTGKLIKPV